MQEPSGMINLGKNATKRDVEKAREAWLAGEYPCGGVLGVAAAWFVAGLFVATFLILLWNR